ncbi:MAG: Fic family protein [Terrimicrobiaceae bacterium]|nr:Fic family protein [Terrimicrobiaceae bacterium]
MPDWDEDSPQLRRNLLALLRRIRDEAETRVEFSLSMVREWQTSVMEGLTVPEPAMVGHFRGERGLKGVEVSIGGSPGTPSAEVPQAVRAFVRTLKRVLARLDGLIPAGSELDTDQLAAVLEVCAWAHARWIQIHPFANGNGRTARLLANSIAMRYGLPPFVRLRPRPNHGYEAAGQAAMSGNWRPMVAAFHRMLRATVNGA